MLPNTNQSSNMAKKNSNLTIVEIWWFCFRKNGNIVTDYSWGHPTSPNGQKKKPWCSFPLALWEIIYLACM